MAFLNECRQMDGWMECQADRHLLPRYICKMLLRNMHSAFRVFQNVTILGMTIYGLLYATSNNKYPSQPAGPRFYLTSYTTLPTAGFQLRFQESIGVLPTLNIHEY